MTRPCVPDYQREFHRRRAVADVISVVKAKRGVDETHKRVDGVLQQAMDAARDEALTKLAKAVVGFLA